MNVATKLEQFETSKENLQKWRKIFRCSNANLNDFSINNLINYEQMKFLDRYVLFKLYNYKKKMKRCYEYNEELNH